MMASDHAFVEGEVLTTKDLSAKWNAGSKTIAAWCKDGYISGAAKEASFPGRWLIPRTSNRPLDQLLVRELLWQIVEFQNGRISEIDLTTWGIPVADVNGCIKALLDNDYLVQLGDKPVIRISCKGLLLLGRKKGALSTSEPPVVLMWAASVGGVFAGSLIDQLV